MESMERSRSLSGNLPRRGNSRRRSMRPLIRSLFMLSLAAGSLAVASPAEQAVATTVPAATSPVKVHADETIFIHSEVEELKSEVAGVRRALAEIRKQEDGRTGVIGDPNNHSLWP